MTVSTTPCKPSADNKSIAKSIARHASERARANGVRYTTDMGKVELLAYRVEHQLSARRFTAIAAAFDALEFAKTANSADALFAAENGDRHRRLADMRRDGKISTPEFDALYEEEAQWLARNDIKYYPALGWHFTR